MQLQQIFVACLSACLILQHVAAVVNTGKNKKIEEPVKPNSESKNNDKEIANTNDDLVGESSEKANRREASIISQTYGPPSIPSQSTGHFNSPVPIYGVPNTPSNNVVYTVPTPDIPPPPLQPSSLYGAPSFGKTYGVPQINPLPAITKGYGLPLIKYGAPSFSSNQYSASLIPPKPIYGPPKSTYGAPGKPFKFQKYPLKTFGIRPPKPAYGTPLNFKDNLNFNKLSFNNNNFKTNSFNGLYTNSLSSNNAFSSLYSGLSSLNHQYGVPILPPKQTSSPHYETAYTILSSQYDIPAKTILETPVAAYGPPQPSPNPKPPHPGAPAPPTPPDIKYDGWQPIPGLISKRPIEEVHHITAQGSGYHDITSLSPNNNQLGDSYGAPPVTLDISLGNSLLDKPGLSNSYGVPLNSLSGLKTEEVSDSYSAPLGTVTGSGGVVESSGAEAHGGSATLSQLNSHSDSQSLGFDLSSIGIGQGLDIQAVKSVEYDINSHGVSDSNTGSSLKLSNIYKAPGQNSISLENSHASKHFYTNTGSLAQSSKTSFPSLGHKSHSLYSPTKGLISPNGIYGVPPSSQYGTPLYSSSYGNYRPPKRPLIHREPIQQGAFQNIAKETYNKDTYGFGSSSSSIYLPPPPPPVGSITSNQVPIDTGAISFQNVVHGSSTAGIDFNQNILNIEGASSLPLTSYNVPLGSGDENYKHSSTGNTIHVAVDFSHPPQTTDLTQAKQASLSNDCTLNNQQHQGSSLAYDVPSATSHTSLSSVSSTNIATSQNHGLSDLVALEPHRNEISQQYGVQDLSHSSSIKTEAKINSIAVSDETHGKNYGKSVAESFGPNSELVESHSIDLNNIPLQGNLGSYTLQIQSADGSGGQVPHTQVLNDGLLQSILQAIEQPGQQGQNSKYPIILQPSIERNNYSVNETIINNVDESQSQGSEIKEVIVEAPESTKNELSVQDNEETLQLLDTSNIALYYKKDDDVKQMETSDKAETPKSKL